MPAAGGGRVAAVEVMVTNARIADLIRENRPDEVLDAIADGEYFQMQTFQQALIDLVMDGRVEEEIASTAASNRDDFLGALVELLTSMAILMIVVGSLGTLFVSGSNAETDLNRRFTAQENARLALDQLRHDVHNACDAPVTTGASTQSVGLTVPGAAPSFTCTASY